MARYSWFAAAAVLAAAPSAYAGGGQYLEMRLEQTRFRSMGGVDIAVDAATPANGSIGGGTKLTVLGLDVYATLSEGIRAHHLIRDAWETGFSSEIETTGDLAALEDELREFADGLRGDTLYLEFHNRIDLLSALFNKGPWTVQLGAYSETLGGARAWAPDEVTFVSPSGGDPYIDFGRDTTLLRAGARTDLGLSFGFGVAIPIAEKFKLAIGSRARGFYRVSLPEHVISVNSQVYGSDDLHFPREISRQQGWGIGVDLYAAMHFSDDLTGFRIGTYIEDIFKYVNRGDETFFAPPRFGVGLAWVSSDARFTIGADVERIETLDPTFQFGFGYRAGKKAAYFTPKFGLVVNHRDITGTELSPAVTTGLDVNVGPALISAAGEYQTATRAFNAGFSLRLGF